MPRRPRPMGNNARACVEDIVAIVGASWPAILEIRDRAQDRYMDPVLLADAAKLIAALAVIQHHARNAQRNVYEERHA